MTKTALPMKSLSTNWARLATPLALLVVGFCVCGINKKVVADGPDAMTLTPAKPGQAIPYRDRLVAGLQARLKSETAFIDEVSDKVEAGELPRMLVDQTFFWARNHASQQALSSWTVRRSTRPIIYFKPAMIARAKRIGVVL